MSEHTQLQHESKDGNRFQFVSHRSDSPFLPVGQLKELHDFRPELVDFVIDQTRTEAAHRRTRQTRVDLYILVERLAGLVAGGIICAAALAAIVYLAMNNHETTATALTAGLTALAGVFVFYRRSHSPEQQPQQAAPRRPRGSKRGSK